MVAGEAPEPGLGPTLDRVDPPSADAIQLVLAPPAVASTIDEPTTGRPTGSGSHRRSDAGIWAHAHPYTATIPRDTLDDLLAECHRRGLQVASVTTAEYAWAHAANSLDPSPDLVAVELTEATELRLIVTRDGTPTRWRRLPLEATEQAVAKALESLRPGVAREAPRILPLGSPAFRTKIATAATSLGWRIAPDHLEITELDHDPLAVAAAYAGTGPRFVPPEVVSREKKRNRRRALAAAAAAVALLATAAVTDILDLRAETAAVETARAGVAAEVDAALAAQTEASALADVVTGVEALRATTPRWTTMLATLADALPRDAVVRTLQARGDSVYVELEGDDVASTVDALRAVPWWTGLRAVGAVQTDVGDDGTITERLTVAARLMWEPLNETEGRSP